MTAAGCSDTGQLVLLQEVLIDFLEPCTTHCLHRLKALWIRKSKAAPKSNQAPFSTEGMVVFSLKAEVSLCNHGDDVLGVSSPRNSGSCCASG